MGTFFRAESLFAALETSPQPSPQERGYIRLHPLHEDPLSLEGRAGEGLLLLHSLVLLYGFGRDSGGVSAGGVGLLDVGSRGGDSAPRFAGGQTACG